MSDQVEEEEECPDCPVGLPGWLATFADLMALMMCFFVLLLSFSEMNAIKYKQIAGSMRDAFGVQSLVEAKQIPKGTSIIAQEYSPGKPEPTPINEVKQHTVDDSERELELMCTPAEESDSKSSAADEAEMQAKLESTAEVVSQLIEATEARATALAQALQEQVDNGSVEIETKSRKIVIRVQEKGSFDSGAAELQADFFPIMDNIRDVLADTDGKISVEGHTDSIPIDTARFESNWALSSARSVSVAHALMFGDVLNERRFEVKGVADTQPLVSNETAAGRAKNRRVEIVVQESIDPQLKEDLKVLQAEDAELFESLNLDDDIFDLRADEIY